MSNELVGSIAVAFETVADSEPSLANLNEAGWWLRIAEAAEVMAGATTTGDNLVGYMRRAAMAVATFTNGEFDDPPANQPAAYVGSMVANLEQANGQTYSGSLMGRLLQAISAYEPEGGTLP